ncbi:TetR family transcriptional regulator [Paenibacillus spiritus]|uniref:TetR family transcriptional regulator n=1 Tax=Paenibacillus spiritus TaxID=2496557 RepID=A0A5J5GC71_9BACL|nr:TetR/AcrR family transcriptional regulator [Paenibacillus spiritus]KAA9005034.1 TetR family transcriptional regulator [Paenibacillus spiritus]
MNKKQQQTEETRRRIAAAARPLFIQKGYNATAIDDIVKATGCSAGNIYYHFKSKEGLFLYLIEEWDTEWEEVWRSKEADYPTVAGKLYGLAEHMAMQQMNHPLTKAVDEFYNNTVKDSHAEERIREMVNGYLTFNRNLLQQGMDSGEFAPRDAARLAVILDSLLYGLSLHTREMGQEEALAAYRLAIDVFLSGVAGD